MADGANGAERGARFGIRLPPCRPAAEVADFACEVERSGFDTAWLPDSQFLFREVWITAALAADRTDTLEVGIAVTNFETRHPTVTAAAISTLAEVADGRLAVGFGSGETAVKTLGMRPTSVRRMGEQFEEVRTLLDGGALSFDDRNDRPSRRMRLRTTPQRPVPLYLAATGPRMLALAGATAAGVIVLAGSSPALIRRAIALVREGARGAGRSFDDLEVVLAAHTAVAEDPALAVRQVKPMVVQTAQHGGSGALREIGIEVDVPAATEDVYPSLAHAEDWDAAIDHAEQWVTDEMAERYAARYALVGTPDSVSGRLREAVSLGVSAFYILGLDSYALPAALVDVFRDHVIPTVNGAAA